MRKVGEFQEEKKALRFWNYLKERGMDSSLEKEDGDLWLIWVDDEEKVEQAATAYGEFAENPDDPKFLSSKPLKKPEREEEERVDSAPKARGFEERRLREQWRRSERRLGPMTLSLIITTTCVFFVSLLTKQNPLDFKELPNPPAGFMISGDGSWDQLLSGQAWRLVTPIFVHFGLLHIVFNLLWLGYLGTQIESRKGSKFMISFVVLLAVVSNLAQFLASGPNFGGMSGVVYGLFGYVWIKSRLDPGDGFYVEQGNAIIMFGFFVLCCMGWMDQKQADGSTIGIANWAHAGGLVVGLAWGYGSALRWNRGKG